MQQTTDYETKIEKLENELMDMTIALSQAWDQLVPLLQDVPEQVENTQDIIPILHTIAAATDTEVAGIYLLETRQWHSIPQTLQLDDGMIERLFLSSTVQTLDHTDATGDQLRWAFAPVVLDHETIGMLGIGTHDLDMGFNSVTLRILVRMAERIGSQIAAAQLTRLREQEAVAARDMQIASDVQQSVQPATMPDHKQVQIASYWHPAKVVGGDAWGWVQSHENRLVWFIIDVAGKGLPAALSAVALHTSITMALRLRLSPVDTLNAINAQFYDAYTRTDLMATVAILSLNLTNGALEIANAGHPPVLIRHRGQWLQNEATAPPIGVLPDLGVQPEYMMLQRNDLMICYSDGFSEIRQGQGNDLWGQDGILRTIPAGAKNVKSLTQHIVSASEFVGPREDDQTLIAAIYTGP